MQCSIKRTKQALILTESGSIYKRLFMSSIVDGHLFSISSCYNQFFPWEHLLLYEISLEFVFIIILVDYSNFFPVCIDSAHS